MGDESFDNAFSLLTFEDSGVNHLAREVPDIQEGQENDLSDEPFYVHIDIINNAQPRLATTMNSYMLRKFYFDPRRYFNFFDDVMDAPITLRAMRRACVPALAASYYELWKVKKNFSVEDFFDHIAEAGITNSTVRVTCMIGGDHLIFRKEF